MSLSPQIKVIDPLPLPKGQHSLKGLDVSTGGSPTGFKPLQPKTTGGPSSSISGSSTGTGSSYGAKSSSSSSSGQNVSSVFKPPQPNKAVLPGLYPTSTTDSFSVSKPHPNTSSSGPSSGSGSAVGSFYKQGTKHGATSPSVQSAVRKQQLPSSSSTDVSNSLPVKNPAVTVRGKCVSHSEERFRVEVGYHAELIALFKNIPSRNYGEVFFFFFSIIFIFLMDVFKFILEICPI